MININSNLEQLDVERSLYLRTFLTGERQGPLTGKPSQDRPWLDKYSLEELKKFIPYRRIYSDLIENSKDYLDAIAIEYFNKKTTYKEVIDKIEKTASALVNNGVKKGDKVAVAMPYLPETVYTIYALNKIGAIVNMIDPRINSELMTDYINNANSEFAIIIDKVEKKIDGIIDNTSIKKVISVSPTNSMSNPIIRKYGNLKSSKFMKWEEFLETADGPVETAPFEKDELAIIEYTSGTSGNPKGVELSNESLNSLSFFQKISLKNSIGDKFLLIMPPFIAYGLVIGLHNMLCYGQHLLMIPGFTLDKAPKMLPKLINKHEPNWIMGVPNFVNILMEYNKKLPFLKGIIVGGDHLNKNVEMATKEYLLKQDSPALVLKGWGMTEIASCGTFTKTDEKNELGSVGVPLSKNIVKIFPKSEDGKYDIDGPELSYGEEGIMFIYSPSEARGYYKNQEETDKVFFYDKDGRRWVKTDDIFRMDNEGNLYFANRQKRIVVRPDGHNIPITQIELIASSFEEVYSAVVVGTPSKKYKHGSMASLCIELKDKNMNSDQIKELLNKIEKTCEINLQPRDRAKYYIVVDKIPYTNNGKIDSSSLQEYANESIESVYIDEDDKKTFYIVQENKKNKQCTRKRK